MGFQQAEKQSLTSDLPKRIRQPMRVRLLLAVLALVLVAPTLTLMALAYAKPPDPAWVLGFWDDDDFDDVVGYVTSATGLVQTSIAGQVHPIAPRQSLKLPAFQAVAASIPRSPSSPRAPPTL